MMEKKYSFLALGDSYTIGEAVSENERWPNQLVDLLKNEHIQLLKPHIIATTGWTTSELLEAIEKENINQKYDFVSLLIGVNNQYRGQSKETYRREFINLLEKAIDYASGKCNHVCVISIPDYGMTPYAKEKNPSKISSEIDEFNQINYSEAEKHKVKYVEITKDSRKAQDDTSLLAPDLLHPSGKMYLEWAKKVKDIIKTTL